MKKSILRLIIKEEIQHINTKIFIKKLKNINLRLLMKKRRIYIYI